MDRITNEENDMDRNVGEAFEGPVDCICQVVC